MAKKKELQDLGTLAAATLGFGPLDDPDWLGLGVTTEDSRVVIALPTLHAVEAAAMHLQTAQLQAKNLPLEQVTAALERHVTGQLSVPVTAAGIRLRADGEEMLINLGIGVLRLRLLPAAQKELKEITAK